MSRVAAIVDAVLTVMFFSSLGVVSCCIAVDVVLRGNSQPWPGPDINHLRVVLTWVVALMWDSMAGDPNLTLNSEK